MHRPFLSHKREDADLLAPLRQALLIRGAGAWQDVHDLTIGSGWEEQLREALNYDTQGFIWFGTRASLASATIRDIELPLALERRKANPRGYPLVPAFVDLHPSRDRQLISDALGPELADKLLALNGVPREPGETAATFGHRIAASYSDQMVRGLADQGLRIRISGRPVPADGRLVLDWSSLLDEGAPETPESVAVMQGVLDDIRNAAHSVVERPRIEVQMDLRLPLAAMVGSRWSRIRSVAPIFVQGSERAPIQVDPSRPGQPVHCEEAVEERGGTGPTLIAVSACTGLGTAVTTYADQIDAAAVHLFHVTAGTGERGVLEPDEIAWLAHRVLKTMRAICAGGAAKHLLILGPSSLAAAVGYGANGTGRTTVPIWDRDRGYAGSTVIH